jgi:hypothetical protein
VRHRVVVGAAIAGLAAAPLALALDFGRSADVAVGPQPSDIAVLYVDDDDHLDLVTANASATGVSILLGNGNGTFRPRIDISEVGAARGIAVGDFNADGWDDVAVANAAGNSVSLLLGNGGTLVPGGRFPVGASPQAVVADDLDSDGNQDLVTANGGSRDPAVSILLGLGDGTFGQPDIYDARTGAESVAVTDVDTDGIVDIVSTDSSANTVSFLIGTGEGTFEPGGASRPLAARPWSVTPGARASTSRRSGAPAEPEAPSSSSRSATIRRVASKSARRQDRSWSRTSTGTGPTTSSRLCPSRARLPSRPPAACSRAMSARHRVRRPWPTSTRTAYPT